MRIGFIIFRLRDSKIVINQVIIMMHSIRSSGVPLAFRFQDTQYGDNYGTILIEVARETPGIAIKKDTLDFGIVRVGNSKTLPDSIGSYGVRRV